MRAICLYLHIHQPVRYREYSIFDVSNDSNYFNDQYTSRQSILNQPIFLMSCYIVDVDIFHYDIDVSSRYLTCIDVRPDCVLICTVDLN